MSRSLKVTSGWIRRAKIALNNHFSSQKELAGELGIARYKVSDFFNEKPVDPVSFVKICQRLELEWQKVAKISEPILAEVISLLETASDLNIPASNNVRPEAKMATSSDRKSDPTPQGLVRKTVIISKEHDQEPDESSPDPNNPSSESIPKLASHLFRVFGSATTPPDPDPTATRDNEELQIPDPVAQIDAIAIAPEPTATREIEVAEAIAKIADILENVSERTSEQHLPVAIPKPVSAQQVTVLAPEPPPPAAASVVVAAQVPDQGLAPTQLQSPVKQDAALETPNPVNQKVPDPHKSQSEPTLAPDHEDLLQGQTSLSGHESAQVMLGLYQQAYEIQDWDTAAEAIKYVDWQYFRQTGALELALQMYKDLLPENWQNGAHKVSDLGKHCEILHNAGNACYYLDDLDAAVNYYDAALTIADQLDDAKLKMQALNSLGLVYQAANQHQTAIKFYQQYMTLASEIVDQDHQSHAQVNALCNLGNTYYALRQYRTAIRYYQQLLTIATKSEHLTQNIYIFGNLGNAYYSLGDYQTAIDYQHRHLEISKIVSNPEKEATALISLGFAYAAMGLDQTAIEHLQQALDIARQINQRKVEMSALKGLGLSYQSLTNYQTAIACFQGWLALAQELSDRDQQIRAMCHLRKVSGYLATVQGQTMQPSL